MMTRNPVAKLKNVVEIWTTLSCTRDLLSVNYFQWEWKVTEENMTVVQLYDLTSSGKIRQLLTLFLHKN